MKLLFIALYDILKYLRTKGNKKELKSFFICVFSNKFCYPIWNFNSTCNLAYIL